MMDLGTIRDMNRSAANRARRHARRPFIPTAAQRAEAKAGKPINAIAGFRIPMMGDYIPRGWETVGEPLFCDKSGCGLESEPALTLRALGQAIAADDTDIGYGSHDEGQFQIYVSRYRRKAKRKPAPCAKCDCADPTTLPGLAADCDCDCHHATD